jgi:uncharacterized protein (TIGR02996 family)
MNPEAFLPAIREAPDEDMPRLVCADWFEEHGQAERAEFIRVQCELARPAPDDERRRGLRQRARALLAAHEEEWAEPLLALVNKVSFRRGFVERVTLEVADFLDGGEQLMALAPIREVVFVKTGPDLPQLADCPHLARVELLDFRDSVINAGLYDLFASPHLGRLRAFVLRLTDGLGDPVLRELAAVPHPPALVTLDVYNTGVTGAGVAALANCPGAATLETLILGGNNLGYGEVVPLAGSPHLARLRTLHLAFAGLEDEDARALAEAPHLGGLHRLDVRYNIITDEAAGLLRQRFGDRVHI